MLGKIMSTAFVPIHDCKFIGVCNPCMETSSAGAFVTACTNNPLLPASSSRSYVRSITGSAEPGFGPATPQRPSSDSTSPKKRSGTPNRPPRPSQAGHEGGRKKPAKRKRGSAQGARPPVLRVLERADVFPPLSQPHEEAAPGEQQQGSSQLPAPGEQEPGSSQLPAPEHDFFLPMEREMSLEFCDEPYEDPTEAFFRQDSHEVAQEMYSHAELEDQERRLGLLCESVVSDMSP